MRLRRLVYVGSLVLLLFCIQESSPTLMLTSLLMALKGGLMVGKMSLGGLMMMLNAASNENQQSAARQNLFASKSPTPFDILSLMSTSHSNNVQVAATATPVSPVPTKRITTPTTMTAATTPTRFAKRRVIRKKIKVKRDVTLGEQTSPNQQIISNITANETNQSQSQDKEGQRRLFRQISNLDPLMCLPKVMCGINSAPPSTKTTILNDYAYLMKTIFARDEDEKKPVVNDDTGTTEKKKNKNKSSSKNDDEADDDSEEEEFALNDEDFEQLALKEEEEIEALANDEMVDEEPGFLPFIMKDVHINNQRHSVKHSDLPADDLHQDGEYEENEYSRPPPYEMSGRPHHRPPPPFHMIHKTDPGMNQAQSSGSLMSYLPKISFGKNKEGTNDAFSTDPFFAGFKRSMKLDDKNITKEQEEILKNIAIKREKRNTYIQRKKKQLELSSDPGEKFKIAAEVGTKLRSPRQCRALFNSCPFKYTEVLSMINNLRKAIQGNPEVAMSDQVNKVITNEAVQLQLQPVEVQSVAPSKNIINVATGNSGHGITSISHQLPNGETVEINLKLLGTPTSTTTTSTTTTQRTTTAKSLSPKPIRVIKVPLSRPNDKEKVFEQDDELVYAQKEAQPFDAATVAGMRDRINSMESLESLKATILAIEKINNATLNRKKYGKPITYDGVFHEVTGLIPLKKRPPPNHEPVNDSTDSSDESNEDDEVDEDLPLNKQNEIQTTNKDSETKKPNRLRPQIHQVPQERIRPKRPTEPTSTTSRIPTNKPKRVINYKTRKPTVSGPTLQTPGVSASKNNTAYKITKVSQKEDPVSVVPFTEKENVVDPTKIKQPPPKAPSNKKPPSKKEEEYDEDEVDGDDNDNDSSEEEEEDEENNDEGDQEQRLNIQKSKNDSQEDDEDVEESSESRVVIKPSITGNPPSQQGPPHGHSPQQHLGPPHGDRRPHGPSPQQGPPHPDRHSHGRPPPQQLQRPHSERHPHGNPPQRHSHGPPPQQGPGRRPQRHAQAPPVQFFRRTFHTYRARGRSIDNDESTSTEKPKHPNHRYPCGVDATTTEKNNEQNSQEVQSTEPSPTTSTQAPPTLPFRYPKYASPHNHNPNTE